jgi:hypothetical protein
MSLTDHVLRLEAELTRPRVIFTPIPPTVGPPGPAVGTSIFGAMPLGHHFPSGPSPTARRATPAATPGRPGRGDAWEPPTGEPDEDAPTDGRQLLGWASPDLKGILIGYGKKKGLHAKIVEWTPQQVAAAYRFARGRLQSTTR